jgi:heat-inducible transcriptional repressor
MSIELTNLSPREQEVLKYIVFNFIKNASPVGSRLVSKQIEPGLSSATIRNVMSDLEEMELIKTPYSSSGRIPTDKGYRFYVDLLMNSEDLTEDEKTFLRSKIEEKKSSLINSEEVYNEISKILGKISHQLAIITQPFLSTGVFEKLEIISLSSNKILVIINITSGFVKTVIMEMDLEISKNKLDKLTIFLNERLQGLTLQEIRDSFDVRVSDYKNEDPELIQLFINSADKLYSDEFNINKIHIGGTGEIIMQPEFDDPKSFKNIIDITEDKNMVIHILQNAKLQSNGISIGIGEENLDDKLKEYSVLCSTYNIGDTKGNIGIIGPKRINYAKMVSLLNYTSKLISEL